jgi:DNA-binding transcriptional LysR family regulator
VWVTDTISRVAELAGMSFIDGPRGYGDRTLIDEAFNAAGLDRTIALEVADVGSAAAYIRHGLGIGFLHQFIFDDVSETGLATLRIADDDLQWRLYVAALATRVPSAAATALLSLIGGVKVS